MNWISPWAGSPREGAANLLECALGCCSSDALTEWKLPVGFDAVAAARRVAAEPDVWTCGSLVDDKVSGASSAGAGCFTNRCSRLWANRRWDHLDEDVGEDVVVSACPGFCSVPGPLQSVQRAEFWGVILALQVMMEYILGLTILELYGVLVACWMAKPLLVLLSWLRMGVLLYLSRGCSVLGSWIRFASLRLRVMLMRPWFGLVGLVTSIGWY